MATHQERNITQSGVISVSMSDHNMVHRIRKFNGSLKRDHRANKILIMEFFPRWISCKMLYQFIGTMLPSSTDINTVIFKWSSRFSSLIDKHVP